MAPFRSPTVLLTLLLAGCANFGPGGASEGQRSYRAARRLWSAARPAAYSFVLERGCFCPPELVGPVRIEVHGDSVLSRTYTVDGKPVAAESAYLFGTMESVFEVIERALAGADAISARYDSVYGFPTTVGIDYSTKLTDDESGLKVTEFRPRAQ